VGIKRGAIDCRALGDVLDGNRVEALFGEQVQQGKSDDQVRSYFSDRYGSFVLFRPSTQGLGLLLWVFPFVLLAGAVVTFLVAAFLLKRIEE